MKVVTGEQRARQAPVATVRPDLLGNLGPVRRTARSTGAQTRLDGRRTRAEPRRRIRSRRVFRGRLPPPVGKQFSDEVESGKVIADQGLELLTAEQEHATWSGNKHDRRTLAEPGLGTKLALANAPLSGSGYFKVPEVIKR